MATETETAQHHHSQPPTQKQQQQPQRHLPPLFPPDKDDGKDDDATSSAASIPSDAPVTSPSASVPPPFWAHHHRTTAPTSANGRHHGGGGGGGRGGLGLPPGRHHARGVSTSSAESVLLHPGAITLQDNEGDGEEEEEEEEEEDWNYGDEPAAAGSGGGGRRGRGYGAGGAVGGGGGAAAAAAGALARDRNKACWARSVQVTDYVLVNGGASNIGAFVVWNIRVETLNGSRMNIRKRYSEFDELRRRLIFSFPGFEAAVPALPPKSVLKRFQPRFLEKRRAGLQYFLNCVLLNPEFSGSPVLKEFLFS